MQTEGEIAAIRLSLGNRIRLIRKSQKLSQYTFADMISLDRSYLIGIEKGRRNLSFDNICKIARGFGMSLSELCEGVDDRAAIDEYLELLHQLQEEEKAKKAALETEAAEAKQEADDAQGADSESQPDGDSLPTASDTTE